MSSSGFTPKNRPLIGRPDRSANQWPVFLSGKPFELMSLQISQKKLTLGNII